MENSEKNEFEEQVEELTAQQKKNKKRKERERKKKLEKKEQEENIIKEFVIENKESKSSFEIELEWCINQIKLGLQNQDATSDQINESLRILQILESKNTPVVKKRQTMKLCFGDYRKLMKQYKL